MLRSDEQGERRIVHCAEIDPDTLLHLTEYGDEYVVRRFDGSDPFSIDKGDDGGMSVCYRFDYDRPLDEEESGHPVEDREWWRAHIDALNRELIGVR